MKKYNISTNPIQVIKNLYNKATSAVLFNSSIGDWFRTTVGVRQGCLLSPTLLKIFLEMIVTDALEDHEGTVSIGGRKIINFRFADDMTRLKPVWIDKSIFLSSKIRMMRSLVTSIILYAYESWTLTAELQRRIQLMEIRCYRKILHISYKDHVTNEVVRAKIQQAIGPHEDILTIVKRHKLHWYGHVSRSSGLAKAIFQDTVKGGGRQGRQRKRRTTTPGNGQAWSSASPRGQWRTGEMVKTGCKIICGAPMTLVIKGLLIMMMMNVIYIKGSEKIAHT